ncbi:hypothetical protein B0J14DRAFT_658587 [Halenospora varia]|nr:hypothetical protein B0J14DRAFT_658587 [Halenospora varia]
MISLSHIMKKFLAAIGFSSLALCNDLSRRSTEAGHLVIQHVKRQSDNPLGFSTWTKLDCAIPTFYLRVKTDPAGTGYSYTTDDLATLYGTNMSFISPGMSFRISERMLQGREQLDFSRAAADPAVVDRLEKYGDGCGFFLRSYWPWDSPLGCVNVDFGPFQCFRIWLN